MMQISRAFLDGFIKIWEMEKYDFIERLFKDEISDELFFGVRHLEVGFHFQMFVIVFTI